jgi:hypothetical protein
MRHLISGEDCAIAGEATAATAAPVAETFKKSRRFIKASPCWGRFPYFLEHFSFGEAISVSTEGALAWGLTTEVGLRKRDEGMTGPLKTKVAYGLEAGLGVVSQFEFIGP